MLGLDPIAINHIFSFVLPALEKKIPIVRIFYNGYQKKRLMQVKRG